MPKPKISKINLNINKLGLKPRPAMFHIDRQSVGFGIKIEGKYANLLYSAVNLLGSGLFEIGMWNAEINRFQVSGVRCQVPGIQRLRD